MGKKFASEDVVSQIIYYVTKHPESQLRMKQALTGFSNSNDYFQADADELVNGLMNLKVKQLKIIYNFITGEISEKMLNKKVASFNGGSIFKKKTGLKKKENNSSESYEIENIFRESSDGELPYLLHE